MEREFIPVDQSEANLRNIASQSKSERSARELSGKVKAVKINDEHHPLRDENYSMLQKQWPGGKRIYLSEIFVEEMPGKNKASNNMAAIYF